MVYIAYFTELNSKIWDYAQKRRICRENFKYALDERFHGHFCPRRKPAKSCHPDDDHDDNDGGNDVDDDGGGGDVDDDGDGEDGGVMIFT